MVSYYRREYMGLRGYLGENTSESHIFHKKVKVSPFPLPGKFSFFTFEEHAISCECVSFYL